MNSLQVFAILYLIACVLFLIFPFINPSATKLDSSLFGLWIATAMIQVILGGGVACYILWSYS